MYVCQRRLEDRLERAGNILDVDDRAPRLAVAQDGDLAAGEGRTDQAVEHGIEAHPRR